MLETEKNILLDLVIASEQTKAFPTNETALELLQKRIHISRKLINGKLDINVFEKFLSIRFPDATLDSPDATIWLNRFVDGWEWQQGDWSTREALQKAAPDVYPTDLNAYFNRLTSPEVTK